MSESPLDLRRYTPRADNDDELDDELQHPDDRWDTDDGWVGDWSDWSEPTDHRNTDQGTPAAPPGFRQVGRSFAPARTDRGPGRVIAGLATAIGIVLLGLVVIILTLPDTESPATESPPTPLPAPLTTPSVVAPSAPAHAIADCPNTRTPALASGTDPGDTTSAVSVIFAFQHAYYVERSATTAREFVTTDAKVPSAEEIQAGIDTVPAGTRYCVSIVPTAPARWQVHVREQHPDAAPELLATLFFHTVTEPDGASKITAISEGP
ncbi:hypothetical protein NN3_00690 [Nocardia neocaledoniensis NBRC 108232]|uniref:DUF8176 domain-containing protein n=1 Tax=Nocardia neocaledoniensis TaxID=236511 RepID=A0A317NH60_9NOCA|nr:hypothetical protein [Nocardia neocaledoniensis]PWV74442.1 hypothetical protein DFR69_106253 [Nocardia neocaledoniensis]GEM29062.1 hypothetical protein NN3_00690 [Nocardia neocaledoniensis NBRC 108232]